MSANGVFVNGERVYGSERLSRSDVLRVGMRISGSTPTPAGVARRLAAPAIATPAVPRPPCRRRSMPAPAVATPRVEAPAVAPAPVAAEGRAPAPNGASRRGRLPATSGVWRAADAVATAAHADRIPPDRDARRDQRRSGHGTRYPIRTPLAHVGRGAHNDVRLIDGGVSETHAKLQRRRTAVRRRPRLHERHLRRGRAHHRRAPVDGEACVRFAG